MWNKIYLQLNNKIKMNLFKYRMVLMLYNYGDNQHHI